MNYSLKEEPYGNACVVSEQVAHQIIYSLQKIRVTFRNALSAQERIVGFVMAEDG